MLTFLRSMTRSWLAYLLFGLLILSFALFGIGDVFRGGANTGPVAEVAGEPITAQQAVNAFNQEMQRMRQVFGTQLDVQQARQFGLLEQAVQRLVSQQLQVVAARDLGLTISDERVRNRLREATAFQDASGSFSSQQFRRVLASNNLTEEEYLQSLRESLRVSPLTDAIAAGAAPPGRLVDRLYVYRNEQREATVLTLPHEAIGSLGTPNDEALRQIYQNNEQAFTAPEYRTVTVLEFGSQAVLSDIRVSEETLRQRYQNQQARFSQPDQRRVRQVVVDQRQTADQLIQTARQAGSLGAALTQSDAQGPDDLIDLDWVARPDLPEALAEPVFSTSPGAIGGPVESALGFHVFEVLDRREQSVESFEQVRDQLRDEIRQERAQDELFDFANTIRDRLAAGDSLESIADSFNLDLQTIEAVSRQGRNRQGEPVEVMSDEMVARAFETQEGERSRLIDTAEGTYFLVRVDGIEAPQLRPFEAVREQVVERWRSQRRRERAQERIQQALARAQEGATLSGLVDDNEAFSLRQIGPFGRQGQSVSGMPGQLISQLFATDEGGFTTFGASDTHYLAQVTAINRPDPRENPDERQSLATNLANQMGQDMTQQFDTALRERYSVRIFQSRLDNLQIQVQ